MQVTALGMSASVSGDTWTAMSVSMDDSERSFGPESCHDEHVDEIILLRIVAPLSQIELRSEVVQSELP